MKNLMSQCPEELVEVICETYPDYWPLTQEQIDYYPLPGVTRWLQWAFRARLAILFPTKHIFVRS